jgi:predicted phosphodiesterase
MFPAMGNHECTGATTSNCGPGTADGITNNYTAFTTKLLAPLGKSSPNYVIAVNAIDGAWTSKLVFVAGNAWTSSDATWLDGVLSQPTTYTFIVRHEPAAASNAPGCSGSEAIMKKHPYTLAIVGHTHTYGKTGARQVTIGNGGAPLTGGVNYGYGLVQQRNDGAIQVDMVDYGTGQPDLGFRFAVKPDGSPAP